MAGFTGWTKTSSVITKQAIDATSTTLENPLGTKVTEKHADYGDAEFIYLAGVASTAQGDAVTFDEAYATTRAAANAVGRVGVAMSANVANQYGWYCIYGRVPCEVAASCAADKSMSLSGTAGHLDDGDQSGDVVIGAVSRSAIDTPNTGQAWMELNYPMVADVVYD